MSDQRSVRKKRTVNLTSGYYRRLEKSTAFSLFFFCLVFYFFPILGEMAIELEDPGFILEIFPPPRTDRPEPPPKPKTPSIPVEADEDEILDEVDIDFLDMQKDWLTKAPTPPVHEDTTDTFEFIAVSEKPKLIKAVAPIYPKLAEQAGVTGIVVVKVLIDKAGNVEEAGILKSSAMLDEAALAAAWQLKFKPGKQRDKFVKVWMSVPFHFQNPN